MALAASRPSFSHVCTVCLKDFPALSEFFFLFFFSIFFLKKKVLVFVAGGTCQVHVVKLVSI